MANEGLNMNRPPHLFNKNFILAFIIQVMNVFCFSIFGTVFPLWITDKFNVNSAEVGLILGLSGISSILTRLIVGYLLDRIGRKIILQVGLIISSGTILLFLLLNNPLFVFILRFVQIIPLVAASTALITIVTDTIPVNRRGEGLSYFTSSTTLPLAIGPFIGFALYHVKWNYPFIVASGIGLISFFMSFFFSSTSYVIEKDEHTKSFPFEKNVALPTIITTVAFLSLPAIFSFVALYAKEVSIKISHVGYVYTSFAASMLITRLIGAKTIDNKAPKSTGVLGFLFLICGLIFISVLKNLLGLMAGSFLVGAGTGILFPMLLMMSINMAPDKKALCNAMVYGGIDIANIVGPMVFGVITNTFQSYGLAYLSIALIEIFGLVIFLKGAIPKYQKIIQK